MDLRHKSIMCVLWCYGIDNNQLTWNDLNIDLESISTNKTKPYARSPCTHSWKTDERKNSKKCYWKKTCSLKVILTISLISVHCQFHLFCWTMDDWPRMARTAGGWTLRRKRWLTSIKCSCDANLHTFYHISFTAAIFGSQQFPIAFLLCISLTARACFSQFFFSFATVTTTFCIFVNEL